MCAMENGSKCGGGGKIHLFISVREILSGEAVDCCHKKFDALWHRQGRLSPLFIPCWVT